MTEEIKKLEIEIARNLELKGKIYAETIENIKKTVA